MVWLVGYIKQLFDNPKCDICGQPNVHISDGVGMLYCKNCAAALL